MANKLLIVTCLLPFVLVGVNCDIVASGQATLLTQAAPLQTDILTQSASATNVLNTVQSFASDATALATGVSSYLSDLASPFLDAFNNLFNSLLETLSPVLSCVFQLPGQLTQAITNAASPYVACVTPIGAVASDLLNQVLNVQLATQAVNLVKSLTDVVGCLLSSLLNPGGLISCVLNLVNSVLNTLVSLLGTILGLVTKVLGSVLSLATCLLSATTNVLASATSLVTGLVSCAASLGSNVTLPTLPGVPTDHSGILNDGFAQINATVPQQKDFDNVVAVANATATNLTNLLPNYTTAVITKNVTKASGALLSYLNAYAKIYQSRGDTVTANCALNASSAIAAYTNQTVTNITTQLSGVSYRTSVLQQQTLPQLAAQKFDLATNKGYAAVTKCDTTFAPDSQVKSCVQNAVQNYKSTLNGLSSQANSAKDELNALSNKPTQLVNNGLLANGNFASTAFQQAKKCSGNKL